jgi:hypothetical protein
MPDFSQLDQTVRAAFKLDFDDVQARGTQRRTRARRRAGVVACGLAVLVAAGGAVVFASTRDTARVVTGTPSTSASVGATQPVVPDLGNLKPLAEVWPHAVRRLPERLPDGSTYGMVKAIGGDRYVVHAKKALWTFDVRAGRAVRLMDEAAARTLTVMVAVSGDWLVRVAPRGTGTSDIWAVRVTGGQPALVVSDVSIVGNLPVVVNGDVVWAQLEVPTYRLMRAPVTGGGPVTEVPGGAGWSLDGFVWAYKHEPRKPLSNEPQPMPDQWNLVTGERRGFTLHADARALRSCSPDWCLVTTNSGRWAIQPWDGSRLTEGPVPSGLLDVDRRNPRFVSGHVQVPDKGPQGGGTYAGWRGVLWDLETGRAGYGGGPLGTDGFWEPRGSTGVVPLDTDTYLGRAHNFLDLTAL